MKQWYHPKYDFNPWHQSLLHLHIEFSAQSLISDILLSLKTILPDISHNSSEIYYFIWIAIICVVFIFIWYWIFRMKFRKNCQTNKKEFIDIWNRVEIRWIFRSQSIKANEIESKLNVYSLTVLGLKMVCFGLIFDFIQPTNVHFTFFSCSFFLFGVLNFYLLYINKVYRCTERCDDGKKARICAFQLTQFV